MPTDIYPLYPSDSLFPSEDLFPEGDLDLFGAVAETAVAAYVGAVTFFNRKSDFRQFAPNPVSLTTPTSRTAAPIPVTLTGNFYYR